MEDVADDVHRRYGNNLSVLVGTGSIDKLRSRGGQRRVWDAIVAEGRAVIEDSRARRHA
jgi:hypothetical protein